MPSDITGEELHTRARVSADAKPIGRTPRPTRRDSTHTLSRFFREQGLNTFVRWDTFFTNPPQTIAEDGLREGFAISDKGLAITDAAVDRM